MCREILEIKTRAGVRSSSFQAPNLKADHKHSVAKINKAVFFKIKINTQTHNESLPHAICSSLPQGFDARVKIRVPHTHTCHMLLSVGSVFENLSLLSPVAISGLKTMPRGTWQSLANTC